MIRNNPAERKAFGFNNSCVYLGIDSRGTLYKLIAEGSIQSFTIGRRRYVLKEELDRYLESRMEQVGDDSLS